MERRPGLGAFIRRFLIACVIVTLLFGVAVAAGDRAGKHEFAKRQTVQINDGVLAAAAPAKPANFLLIGHDADGNSDTMMVVHLDPATKTPLLVSFPRDLIVNIPGHGEAQLNAALPLGGPSLLIETFAADFHVPITHYMQVDFNSFPPIVDAIGHVNVWFPTPVHDPYIGLNEPQAGCVSLDGQTALAYVRSRHYYVPENLADPAPWQWNYSTNIPEGAYRGGAGWVAIGSDIERIPRQQYFLRTLAQAAISKTNDDPLRIINLADAVFSHLTTDQSLTFGELKSFIRTFRAIKPKDVAMTTIPWEPDPANPNRVVLKEPDAISLLDQLANLTPPHLSLPTPVPPRTVSVRVVNGTGIPGLAAQVQQTLVAAGFRAAGPPADADRSTYMHTEIRWQPGDDAKGTTVVVATGARNSGESPAAADTRGADVLVIVGRDWPTLNHQLTNLPGQNVSTTTTTLTPVVITPNSVDPHYLPVDPKTGGTLVGCPS